MNIFDYANQLVLKAKAIRNAKPWDRDTLPLPDFSLGLRAIGNADGDPAMEELLGQAWVLHVIADRIRREECDDFVCAVERLGKYAIRGLDDTIGRLESLLAETCGRLETCPSGATLSEQTLSGT